MDQRWLAAALLAAFLAAPFPSAAATDSATAAALLKDSGLWDQLGQVVRQVEAEVDEVLTLSREKPEGAEMDRFRRLVRAAYEPGRLRAIAIAVVEKETSEQHVPALQEWFASKDGKEITRVESVTPDDREGLLKLRKDGAAILEQLPARRRDLLEDILIASRSTEIAATISIRSTLSVVAALRRANPGLPIPSEVQLRAQMEAGRSRMQQAMSASYLQMYASVYRTITDAQLEKYGEVMSSSAGRHFTEVLAKAIEAAMVDGASHLGADLFPPGKDAST